MLALLIKFKFTTLRCAANCFPLLIQQHVDGSDAFNRSWAEFKVGFNDTSGNYWLGNDLLSELTRYKLRFDLQARDGTWYYAQYSSFVVQSEANNYKLLVAEYTGNAGDALIVQDGMMFTTYDRDNDRMDSGNCAVDNGGGFWYNYCAYASVNVESTPGSTHFRWSWHDGYLERYYDLQTSRMWLTC